MGVRAGHGQNIYFHPLPCLLTSALTLYHPFRHLKLQVRMNVAKKAVEMRTSSATTDSGALYVLPEDEVDMSQTYTLYYPRFSDFR